MKKLLAAALLSSLLVACTTDSDEPQTTPESPTADGSAGPETTPEATGAETDSPAPTESETTDDGTTGPETTDAETSAPSDEEPEDAIDESDFAAGESQSEGFPDLVGDFLPTQARIGGHEFYDRIVIDYDAGEGQLNWYARYEESPIEDGSGFEVDMAGEQFLTLSVAGIRYPEESEVFADGIPVTGLGQSLIVQDVHVNYPFEGMHQIFIGVDEERPYRVQVFHDPERVVIDILND